MIKIFEFLRPLVFTLKMQVTIIPLFGTIVGIEWDGIPTGHTMYYIIHYLTLPKISFIACVLLLVQNSICFSFLIIKVGLYHLECPLVH